MEEKKVIWITGASSGIGKALAIKFAENGWVVAASARRENLLNELKKINQNIFLTINPFFKIDQNKIFNEIDFTHPYYDENALQNQSNLKSIQNVNNTLFAGSYFGYGFHEDGIKSSIEMLKTLND